MINPKRLKELCVRYITEKERIPFLKYEKLSDDELKELMHYFNLKSFEGLLYPCKIELQIINQYEKETVKYNYASYKKAFWNKINDDIEKSINKEKQSLLQKAALEESKRREQERRYFSSLKIPPQLKKIRTDKLLKSYQSTRNHNYMCYGESYSVWIEGNIYELDVVKAELNNREHIKRKNTEDGCNINNKTKTKKFKNEKAIKFK